MSLPESSPSLVSLAAVTWDFALVGRTRMLTEAWARGRQATTFVQVPSLRTALEKLSGRARRDGDASVLRPWPAYPSRWWPHLSEARMLRLIRRRANSLRKQLDRQINIRDATAIVISPVWAPWLESLPFKHVVYDCIDDVSVHVTRPELTRLYHKWENELVARASGAVVTAEPLIDSLKSRRPELPIATIRNGVDVERFQSGARNTSRPADLPDGKRPIVGFVGALYEWIDWRLIEGVSKSLPECDFVFVGPHDGRGSTDELKQRANVRFLGRRTYDQVPSYVNAFDACWVPFDNSGVSKAANPVKMYEYLALGKPVVTTPVADTGSFQNLVRVGRDADEVADHIRGALVAEREAPASEARIGFARANSWDVRAAAYVDFVKSLANTGARDEATQKPRTAEEIRA